MMAESEEALQHNMQELNDRLEEWETKANCMAEDKSNEDWKEERCVQRGS